MAIAPFPVPAMPGLMEGLTSQMTGMTADQAFKQFMDQQYHGGNDLKIGYTTVTTDTPAITGDTSSSIPSATISDPIDAWNDYVDNQSDNVSEVTGGIVSGSAVDTIALSIIEKTDLSPEAVVPVAIPLDAAIVAGAQALGVSIDAAQLDVETKQKFANSIVQSTGMIYDKAKNLVLAWKDKLGNILFPKSVVDAVNDVMDEEGIGGIEGTYDISYDGTSYVGFLEVTEKRGSTIYRHNGGGAVGVLYITPNSSIIQTAWYSKSPFTVTRYTASGSPIGTYQGSYSSVYDGYTASGAAFGGGATVVEDYPIYRNTTSGVIFEAFANGTTTEAGNWPEGTSESQAPSYSPSSLTQPGSIVGEDGARIPVVVVNIPENPYDATGSTIDPNSETDDANIGVIYPGLPREVPDTDDPDAQPKEESVPIPLPIPDTNVSNPDVPLVNPSVIDSARVEELVEELANTLDPQPPQSSGIIPIPQLPGIVDPETGQATFPSIIPDSGPGFIHVYNPTPEEFVAFGTWLWVTYADATIEKILNNPFDGVIGAHELYATPNRGGRDNIRSAFLTCPTTADLVPNRYSEIDCGTVIVPEFYGNYLDYSPYSQAYIYLPFIGINEVSIDDIVGHAVNIRYRIDSYSGSCIAMIFVAKDGYQNLCYQFAGSCSVEVPMAGGSQAAIKAGMMQAEAYARAAMASAVGHLFGGIGSVLMGSLGGTLSSIGGIANDYANAKAGVEAARVANKSSVQHSGQFGASHGAMGEKIPFIIVRNPIQVKVVNYNDDYGYPAHKRVIIGGCTGYLRVREVNVISAHATDAEKAAIEAMLKNGVYVS